MRCENCYGTVATFLDEKQKTINAMTETAKEASVRAILDHNIICELSKALHEITTLKSTTLNYGVARAIAEQALAKVKAMQSSEKDVIK